MSKDQKAATTIVNGLPTLGKAATVAGVIAAVGYGGYCLWKWWTGGMNGDSNHGSNGGSKKQSVAPEAQKVSATIDVCEVVFRKLLQEKGWGFAIDADTVTLDETHYRDSNNATATAWMVTEEGTGNVKIYPFDTAANCLREGSTNTCCWVAYDAKGEEIGKGGTGTARNTCRRNGARWLFYYANKPDAPRVLQGKQEVRHAKPAT